MLFRIVLWSIGRLLATASGSSSRVQSQLARDLVMTIESLDGVSRTFIVNNRRVRSRSGPHEAADCTLRFRTAALGAKTLLSPDTINRLVDGFGTREITCIGEAAVVLWFYELTMGLLPWRRRSTEIWPQSYAAPNPTFKASARIIREPAREQLDPQWTDAHAQREKLILWTVGRGAAPTGKVLRHNIVVDLSDTAPKQRP